MNATLQDTQATERLLPTLDGDAITKYLGMMARTAGADEIVVGLTREDESNRWSSSQDSSPAFTTRFQVGCVGRALNAAIVLELDAAGKIDIDLPVSAYLPEFKGTSVGDDVLVRHVLCGTAGYLGFASVTPADRGMTWDMFVSRIGGAPSIFKPGTTYSLDYSSYVLLAAILERVSGRRWTEVVDETVGLPVLGRRLYEGNGNALWLAAVFNIALGVDELHLLSDALVHGAPRNGAHAVFCESTIVQMRTTVNRVPVLAGLSAWVPRGYGFGLAEYHSDLRGLCGKGSSHLSSIRVLPSSASILSVCVASRNAALRHAVIDSMLAELGVLREPNLESVPLPADVSPEDLCGDYVGLRGFTVTVEFDRPMLNIVMQAAGRPAVRVRGTIDENNIFWIEKRSPVVGVAFFTEPETDCPGLMIGVSALRKA